jgi:hypothetical protein
MRWRCQTEKKRMEQTAISSKKSMAEDLNKSKREVTSIPKQSEYWTVSYGQAVRTGFSCRECRQLIKIGSEIAVRDGRKMRLFYHIDCFSNDSDPRTQQNSSFNRVAKFQDAFQEKAPPVKGRGKWSTSSYGYEPNTSVLATKKLK